MMPCNLKRTKHLPLLKVRPVAKVGANKAILQALLADCDPEQVNLGITKGIAPLLPFRTFGQSKVHINK